MSWCSTIDPISAGGTYRTWSMTFKRSAGFEGSRVRDAPVPHESSRKRSTPVVHPIRYSRRVAVSSAMSAGLLWGVMPPSTKLNLLPRAGSPPVQ